MRSLTIAFVLLVTVSSCSKKTAPGATGGQGAPPTEFDRAWAQLAKQNTDTFYIEDDRGDGLMGNVLRAQTGALAMAPNMAASLRQPNGQAGGLPATPSPEEVQRVIKQNLAGVKSCYMRVSRDGEGRSGKAIVSFKIGASGKVEDFRIDAPAFTGTTLPACVTGQITHWEFPASRQGGLAISYPFVFVGG
jgi:hypothetical protein